MFKKDSKYRLHFLIIKVVLLVIIVVFNFVDFYENKNGMSMIGGIVFGIMTIAYAVDVFEFIKNKKSINS